VVWRDVVKVLASECFTATPSLTSFRLCSIKDYEHEHLVLQVMAAIVVGRRTPSI
jgi:hypothetical protein